MTFSADERVGGDLWLSISWTITPPEPLLGRIEAFRAKWGGHHHRVEPHITIRAPFRWSGPTAPFLPRLDQACGLFGPTAVQLGPPGRFGRNQVLFLSVAGESLSPLHQAVTDSLLNLLPSDDGGRRTGAFHPHLTLAAGRFGISEEQVIAMEADALRELRHMHPFTATALRCYRKEEGPEPWQPFRDIPFGLL